MNHTYTVFLASLLLLLFGLSSATAAQERVYWTSVTTQLQFPFPDKKIQRSDLDGGQVEDLITGLALPGDITLDPDAGKLYLLDPHARKILRANLDGTEVEDLVTGIGIDLTAVRPIFFRTNGRIILDIDAGKMYWTDDNGRTINRANLEIPLGQTAATRTDIETLVEGGNGFGGIALDVATGKMYYSQQFPIDDEPLRSLKQIRRANLDGSNQETLIEIGTGVDPTRDIALDVVAGKIYWTASTLHRANLDGSEEETVFDEDFPYGLALDAAAGKVYVTHQGHAISRANLDGSEVDTLVTGIGSRPEGIALDVTGGKMYWVDSWLRKVQRANLDGSNVEDLIVNRADGPEGIALDVTAQKMYWTDTPARVIRRANMDGANLDGTGVEELVDTGLTGPRGIALDVSAGKMYWAEEFAKRIRRADLNGANEEDVVTGLSRPYGIALDVPAGKMYWTDLGTVKIQKASLGGADIEDLVTTNLVEPRSIALDLFGGKMYWTDFSVGKIQRANLDGSNVEDLLTTQGGGPWDIAVDAPDGKMYWTWRWDEVIMAVRCSDLDGSNIEDVAILDLSSNPGGIALELKPSDLAVNPAGIDFGMVATGTHRDTTFTLINTSPDTLRITGVTTTDSVFTMPDTTLAMAPGDTTSLSVTFAPTGRGEVSAQVLLTSDAPSSPHVVGVRGEGRTVQTVAIATDTSTVVYQDTDGTVTAVTFTDGQISGHTMTVESFGADPPSSVQSVPQFSDPVFYVAFNTTIPDSVSFEATVTLTYTDAQLDSAGILDEDSLKVAWFNETTEVWSTITGVLDAANNTITFTTDHFSVFALALITPTGIEDEPHTALPADFVLLAARPNLFNPSTTISYEVSRPVHVTLVVYNILGQEVARLVDGQKTAGRYTALWTGRNARGQAVGSGIYLYRLTASSGFSETKRMTMIK